LTSLTGPEIGRPAGDRACLVDVQLFAGGRPSQRPAGRARIAELLPLAVRLGVPVLAGTDVTRSIPPEVALLAQLGLEPAAGATPICLRPTTIHAR
jgi:hypothetical protein